MNELAKELARKARARISDERAWCADTEAVDARGETVDSSTETAVAWCATGALEREAYEAGGDSYAWEAYEEAVEGMAHAAHAGIRRSDFGSDSAFADWQMSDGVDYCEATVRIVNDRRGHEAALSLFDKALAAA